MAAGLDRACPVCNAKPHRRCTRPTNTTRVEVDWLHMRREQDDGL